MEFTGSRLRPLRSLAWGILGSRVSAGQAQDRLGRGEPLAEAHGRPSSCFPYQSWAFLLLPPLSTVEVTTFIRIYLCVKGVRKYHLCDQSQDQNASYLLRKERSCEASTSALQRTRGGRKQEKPGATTTPVTQPLGRELSQTPPQREQKC